jgi:hypothetical protein
VEKGGNRLKRRSFLYYIGAFSMAAVSAVRYPFKFLGSRVSEYASNKSSIKVKPNPDAVRRKT